MTELISPYFLEPELDEDPKALILKEGTLPSFDSLENYTREVNKIPLLTLEEEQGLATQLRDHNDLDAARRLIMSHLRFVVRIAKNYRGYGLPLSDLIQEGNLGLMKAVKRFDPTMGVRLVSFAVHWIKAEIHEFVIRNWRIVKISTTKAQRKLFFNLRSMKKSLAWLKKHEVEEIAEKLDVASRDVLEMESRLSGQDIAFDYSPGDTDEEHYSAPTDYLADSASDPAVLFEQSDTIEDQTDKLSTALLKLDARSQAIIRARWLSENGKATLQDLAERYQVSAERIRQLEEIAFKKLKASLISVPVI